MKRLSQVFKRRSFPILTLIALIALGLGYYLFYVRNRESYFTHRYLRLLAFESGRIEERLSTFETILTNIYEDNTLKSLPAKDLRDLPGLEWLERVPAGFQIPEKGIAREPRIEGDHLWLYAGWKQGDTQVAYRFDPFPQSSPEDFDTVFIAARDGTVLYQKNRKERKELRIINIKKLLSADGKELDVSTIAGSTSSLDVLFAGEPYRLFMRPCCSAIWSSPREQSRNAADVSRIQLDVRIAPNGTAVAQASAPPETEEKPAQSSRLSLEWTVGGMVRSSALSTQAWAISFTLGIALISVFVLALLSLPFLRVLAIGPEEKLRVADALWIGFTAIAGMGLLTLLLLDLHAYRARIDHVDERLERFAGEIHRNMQAELKVAWTQLGTFNAVMKRELGKTQPQSCEDLWKAGVQQRATIHFGDISYFNFERFAWMDGRGQQCFKRSLTFPSDPLVQVKDDRRYWQEAQNGQEAIEPVFSTATGSRVVVLSKPVPDRPLFVSILGIEMTSLNRPVLPPGYGFAVIEEDGDVLFHSAPGRAGYENFFEETDNDRSLRALVYAQRSGEVSSPYMGRGHRLWVEPISVPGTAESLRRPPFWTLVTFSDKRDMRAFNVDVLTTAMLFLILYLAVYMLGCGLLRAVKRNYRAGWLWPESKGEPRPAVHFVLAIFYAICLLISGIAIAVLDGLDLVLFALTFPWAVLLVSYRLTVPKIQLRWQIVLTVMVTGVLLLIWWAPRSGIPPELADQDEARRVILTFVCLALTGFYFLGSTAPPGAAKARPRWLYLAAASLLLALTAAMPATAFFCVAHRAHLETRIKRGQIELALSSEQREARLRQTYLKLVRNEFDPQRRDQLNRLAEKRVGKSWDMYHRFYFATARSLPHPNLRGKQRPPDLVRNLAALERSNPSLQPETSTQDPFCLLPAFLQKVLPLYTEDFIRVRRLLEDADRAGRGPYRWQHDIGGQIQIEGASIRLSSTVPSVSLQALRLLWPVSLLLLGGAIFGVAYFIARKILLFGAAMPEPVDPMRVASDLTQNFLFVSDDLASLEDFLRKSGSAVIDLREIESREDLLQHLQEKNLVGSPRICLRNFQHLLQDPAHNLLKLELLEELVFGRDKPVVILSHIMPAWHLLDRNPVPSLEQDDDPEKAAKRQERDDKVQAEIQERWRSLLRRFLIWASSSCPVDPVKLESDLAMIVRDQAAGSDPRRERRRERLLKLAREECGESHQLQVLATGLVEAHLQDLSRDMFLDDLQEKAEPYYRTLWSMCTDEEKLVLVHLAEGGLVNARNVRPLRTLMKRGLVKRSPYFRIMNESFRRFLVAKDNCLSEVRSLERKAEASLWGQMRGPVGLALIGVAAFFFISQRELFDVSVAFVGAVAASLPAVFRVLGSITPGQGKAGA